MQLATAIATSIECSSEPAAPGDTAERDELITAHYHLVRSIAGAIRASSLGRGLEFEDLVSCGAQGLLDAAARFDPSKGVVFITFARHRIRGAIVDGIRSQHWLGRRTYSRLRAEQARDGALQSPGLRTLHFDCSPPLDLQCRLMELTKDSDLREDARWNGRRMVQFPVIEDDTPQQLVSSQLRHLPYRERRLLELCYYENKSLTEAADVLGMQRSWASRLHARALESLRAAIE